MLSRTLVIAMNTYREAVRARILHGLFGLGIATSGYALVVGAYSLRNTNRVVADLGAASISAYAIIVAIMLGATSLYRELELKTIFPILARPIERWEYLLGKFLGTVLTLVAFIAANSGLLLFSLGALTTRSLQSSLLAPCAVVVVAGLLGWGLPRLRSWLPIPVGFVLLALGAWFARDAVSDRNVILGQGLLSLLEVCIVTALTLLFAAFSSPFLTAVFTLAVFLVGRSADTLAQLPERVFGPVLKQVGVVLSRVFPNLMVYVPSRTLLTGEAIGVEYWRYTGWAAVQALGWAVGLLTVSSWVFKRRDFL